MFNIGSRPTVMKSVEESANSGLKSADFLTQILTAIQQKLTCGYGL